MCVCVFVCVCVCRGEDVFVVHLLFIFIFTMYVNLEYSCHLTPSLTFPFQLELPVVKEDELAFAIAASMTRWQNYTQESAN